MKSKTILDTHRFSFFLLRQRVSTIQNCSQLLHYMKIKKYLASTYIAVVSTPMMNDERTTYIRVYNIRMYYKIHTTFHLPVLSTPARRVSITQSSLVLHCQWIIGALYIWPGKPIDKLIPLNTCSNNIMKSNYSITLCCIQRQFEIQLREFVVYIYISINIFRWYEHFNLTLHISRFFFLICTLYNFKY